MNHLDHILPLVSKPSRYTGGETNSVAKSGSSVRLSMALAFPDTYEIGMSHFGLQILYHLLNSRPEIAAERVFAPGTDMVKQLAAFDMPLFSLETRRPLAAFDIVGFSLLYELNYTNVLMMLHLAGIPFYAADRGGDIPMIIAGGPCTVNPEPMAPFFDAMVIGDGEPVVTEMADAWIRWKDAGGGDKTELLRAWTKIRGVYVPSFFSADFDENGRQRTAPLLPGYEKVRRAAVADLDSEFFPESPLVPFGRPVHDRLRLEIARGCTRGCRFCQAGMIYRPVRERSRSRLADLAEKGLSATGYDELSLLSLSTGDYSCLQPLIRELSARHCGSRLALSIPSFRAGTLSSEMMEIIRSVRKTGFTIAPEAGTERLRSVINKNITEAEITDTVKSAFDLGWQLVKLYFMIGLPCETSRDVEAIAELVRRLRGTRPKGKRGGKINVSVGVFIPKSHSPFQWAAQKDPAEAREVIENLRSRLSLRGVEFKWQNPELSRLEGIFARGDRSLARVLVAAWRKGCRFDGWTDCFDSAAWNEAFTDAGVDPEAFLGSIPQDSPLPWDHIDTGVSREFLLEEYKKALDAQPTPDCRYGDCQGCGVCDFETLMPCNASDKEQAASIGGHELQPADNEADFVRGRRFKVVYSKLGPARYFGHLELANILLRALRRAGVSLAYSRGYHPKPKIAFTDALPVGVESVTESFFLTVADKTGCAVVKDLVNRHLPEGLEITDCVPAEDRGGPGSGLSATYEITLPEGVVFDQACADFFFRAASFEITLTSGKGAKKRIDLKSAVDGLWILAPDCLKIRLAAQPGPVVRPGTAVLHIFRLSEDVLLRSRVIKKEEHPAGIVQKELERGLHG
ncbi:MAG: TIGR03960 family B12-binding radical SAM protein [Desulfobacterales bacterium]